MVTAAGTGGRALAGKAAGGKAAGGKAAGGKAVGGQPAGAASVPSERDGAGTVGAVALDGRGHLAAATSTGGLAGKPPGRVGDSAIIGAGTWADDRTVAVSATGVGEAFILAGFAHRVDWSIRTGADLDDAMASALDEVSLHNGSGGAIALTPSGRFGPYSEPGLWPGDGGAPATWPSTYDAHSAHGTPTGLATRPPHLTNRSRRTRTGPRAVPLPAAPIHSRQNARPAFPRRWPAGCTRPGAGPEPGERACPATSGAGGGRAGPASRPVRRPANTTARPG